MEIRRILWIADEEERKKHWARLLSIAIPPALNIKTSHDHCLADEVPPTFGGRWQKKILTERNSLQKKYAKNTLDVIRLAARCFIFAKYATVASLEYGDYESDDDIRGGIPIDQIRHYLTPDGYADEEGRTNITYDFLSTTEPPLNLLDGLSLTKFPEASDTLRALAIIWFFDAASIYRTNENKSHDLLFETSEAIELASCIITYQDAKNDVIQSPSEIMSAIGKRGATVRHRDTRMEREFVKKYWRENIDPTLTNEKAAEKMQAANVVKLSTRKLAEIVSEAKREQKKPTS